LRHTIRAWGFNRFDGLSNVNWFTLGKKFQLKRHRPIKPAARPATPWSEPGPLREEVSRDIVTELVGPERYVFELREGSPGIDRLVKAMINLELHGLMDCAYEIATRFRPMLQTRFDVNERCDCY
jgi:hypothetical protein